VKERILVVDDETNARSALATLLAEEGFEVKEAADGEQALAMLPDFSPAVVLADVRMPRMDGLTLLERAKQNHSEATFLMMTAFASVDIAVQAMRSGAENFLTKPLDVNAVLVILEKALEKRRLTRETEDLRARVRERYSFHNIIGQSSELQAVFETIKQAASTRATVLLLGESGTGKELFAQALHEESQRSQKPFVKVACSALSESLLESELFGHEKGSFTGATARREGRFERADGGTLFLDEIGELSPAIQVKLLRVLQTREIERVGSSVPLKVDVRLVAATNRDLESEVRAGRFREDLFYRLNVVSVTLPPLRRRKGDIPALANHFLSKYAESYSREVQGLAPGTLNALLSHDWPGNVRELENVIERAVVLAKGQDLTAEDLPPTLRGPRPSGRVEGSLIPGASLYEIEREAILRTLEMVGGSTTRAAEVMGISVRKVQYRLKEYAAQDAGKAPPKAESEPEVEESSG